MSDPSPSPLLHLGVVGTSSKENEHRLPLHPAHLAGLDPDLRARITLEHGYGVRFGWSDADLAGLVAGSASREQVLAESDVVLLPKPRLADLTALRRGATLWGWPHCVQDPALTQVAIDRGQTLIAFEAMNHWTHDGHVGVHVFHKNNELAGYCSVIHALQLTGRTGSYGRPLRAVVIGFGATARGAVTALNAHGVHDVCVLTSRGVAAVGSPIHSVRILQLDHDAAGGPDARPTHVVTEQGRVAIPSFLADRDVVVNCTLQDTAAPVTYLSSADADLFRPRSLVVDVSCDEGMGFEWATPTTFDDPMFAVGNLDYYAVDHSPSYLWESATWENSLALLPFLRRVLEGPASWDADETLRRAVEIRSGRVVNPAILAFQGRAAAPPHLVGSDA